MEGIHFTDIKLVWRTGEVCADSMYLLIQTNYTRHVAVIFLINVSMWVS